MKYILSVWNYFKNSWEGNDGKLSYRRVSQYIFLGCMTKMAFGVGVSNQWSFYTFLTFAILYTLVAAIMSVEQVLILLKYVMKVEGKAEEPQTEQPTE